MTPSDETKIEQCHENAEKLSEWEMGFLDSVAGGIEKFGSLTAKQSDKLHQIWNKAVNGIDDRR